MLSPTKLSDYGLIKLELSFFKDSPSRFIWILYVCVLCAQLCPTLHNTMNCSSSDTCVHVSRQEYWSGLSFPPPRDLPDPGIEAMSLESPALAGERITTVPPGLFVLSFSVLSNKTHPKQCLSTCNLRPTTHSELKRKIRLIVIVSFIAHSPFCLEVFLSYSIPIFHAQS